MRLMLGESIATDDGARLALAPALTPLGQDAEPSFFHGFATHPRALAQGLVTLADITASRYFQYTPTDLRDPILTAHGDRLRAEVFSADNSVYARLDVLGSGLDGGEIGAGTTNVDIGPAMRQALSMINSTELFHLDIGVHGMKASTMAATATERPVQMPARWVRALGNAAELHTGLTPQFTLTAVQARAFIATLPPITGGGRSGWLIPTPTGVRVGQRPAAGAVWVDGLNRLTALKRLLTLVTSLTFYGPADGGQGMAAVQAELPGARLVIALTEGLTRGYSGEGSLLEALASPTVLDDAALLNAALSFEPVLDVPRLARSAGLTDEAARDALAVLAVAGRVGWDFTDGAWFHRELPDDPERIDKDNPRLVRARSITGRPGAIQPVPGENAWLVDGGNGTHRVGHAVDGWSCTCAWYLRHGTSRGPCSHALAVTMFTKEN
ncbi:MAG: SWIM zinc finger family protein [Propionibacteriaceae bacterium]|nr:SWIM zinc finger family protein [Propionibacteriaceae bacterium]